MRYMGEMVSVQLDPATKAAMMAAASTMPDSQAKDLEDILEASPYGKQAKLLRYGIGAGAGLVLGFLAARALRKR